jgi:exopolysaccharide biosynthesis polyprenyl glycosylphosphotransferase
MFLSVLLAYGIYRIFEIGKETTYQLTTLIPFALGVAAVGCLSMLIFGAYRRESGILNVVEIRSVILGILGGFAITNALFFTLHLAPSRYVVVLSFLFMLFLVPLARSIHYSVMAGRLPERFLRRVLIYGAGKLGQSLFHEIYNSPRLQLKVCGFVDDDPLKRGESFSPCGFQTHHQCQVLGNKEDIPFLVHTYEIDEINIAISDIKKEKILELFNLCRQLSIDIAFVPRLYDVFTHQVKLDRVGNLPLIRKQWIFWSWNYAKIKRVMDLGLCFVLGILLSPLMTFIALAIKMDSPGPVFFKQKRIGKGGVVFNIFKFRSMFVDAPKYAVNPDCQRDPRITRVGRFLRKTSLDELPQIVNVLKGEMSLVGPRPEMPFIVEQYDDRQRVRLKVQPGITGLWQLSGDRKKAIHENMEYDLYYIYNCSFFLDVTILLQTIIFAFRGI